MFRFSKILGVMLIAIFMLQMTCTGAAAKWEDKSDELPGLDDDSSNTALVVGIAGGVLVGAVLIYVIAKKVKSKKKNIISNLLVPEEKSKLPTVSLGMTKNKGVAVGLSFRF